MPLTKFDWCAARYITSSALHAALNTNRVFSWYYSGFPDPKVSPYRDSGPIRSFRNF